MYILGTRDQYRYYFIEGVTEGVGNYYEGMYSVED